MEPEKKRDVVDEFITETIDRMRGMILTDEQAMKLISWCIIRARRNSTLTGVDRGKETG